MADNVPIMANRCTLCRERIESGDKRVLCQCGQLLHGHCAEAHEEWCSTGGRERWIGTVEL